MHLTICIHGEPIPLQRHRSFIRAGKIGSYDSQLKEKVLFIKKIRSQVIEEGTICALLSKPSYDVMLIFGMPYPKSKMRKNTKIEEIPHTTKPDLDNLIKFVLDCGNGLLWTDDKKIIRIQAKKVYVSEPKTIISIN